MNAVPLRLALACWLAVPLSLLMFAQAAADQPASADQPVDFNHDIRPLLSNNCLTCHGPDPAERAAGLRLDTADGSREDLGGYAAIVPGDPEASELLVRLTTDDEDMRMPPAGKGRQLTASEIDLIRRWIAQGAPYAQHWSYQPPQRSELPAVADPQWPRNPIDHFIADRLQQSGLQPSPAADRLTLARRAAIDLTGLPPTWEEARQFADDPSPDAFDAYVDRLLAKPAFGERWARVWLDLARYADSAGYADDPARTIWAYRDYVIRSLNDNKPFDQFTIEQIAGDLLPDPSEEQLIATAFHRNTMTNNEGGTNDEEFRNVAVVDRVNTTMAVWMGTTMAYAQCHTHKYDPITQDEYFQFFDFFNHSADADRRDDSPLIEIWSDAQEQRKAQLQTQIEQLRRDLDRDTPGLETARQQWLAGLQREPAFTPLVPQQAESPARKLTVQPDGWIQAETDEPDNADYIIEIPTSEIPTGEIPTDKDPWTGIKLEIGSGQQDNFVLTGISATWTPTGKRSVDARYVRLQLAGKDKMIHVAEVEVLRDGVNVARQATATQSSTDFGGQASRAIDGNPDGDYQHNSVTHTSVSKDPWLEIDLGAVGPVDAVTVWNRTDGGAAIADRLQGFEIVLLDGDRNEVWKHQPPAVPQPNASYATAGTVSLKFATANADFQQQGFPAAAVLTSDAAPKSGWAVAPQQGQPHELTLIFDRPADLGEGVLRVQLQQQSVHKQHLLNHFRFAASSDPNLSQWAQMPAQIRELVRNRDQGWTPAQQQQIADHFRAITPLLDDQRRQLKKVQQELAEMKPYTSVPVMQQLPADKRRVTKVQLRGNYLSTGHEVTAATPAAFHPLGPHQKPDRLALAKWLVDDANPLTARVIANRHWEEIFGIGIVETSEEFGSQGELPSHPELLDYLAIELQQSGWDLKHLLKLLVTSATYQQRSEVTPQLIQLDPQNRLYARGPRFRVSAEMVRDQALFVSGLLSDKMFGPPVKPPQPEMGLKAAFGSDTDWTTSAGDDRYRRGLYTTWRRSNPYPSMVQFDAPNREVCTVRRIRTNTPLQALVTLNDPVYVEAAQSLARQLVAVAESPQQRIEHAFRRCLIRDPSAAELQRLQQLVDQAWQHYETRPAEAQAMATDPLGPLPAGADVAEMAAWTVVSNVILNLDELLMKR